MKKKRGNPNWGKPDLHSTAPIQANSFEEIVRKLRLSPEQYVKLCSAERLGAEEQPSKIRAIRLVEGLGFRSCQRLLKIIHPNLLMRPYVLFLPHRSRKFLRKTEVQSVSQRELAAYI